MTNPGNTTSASGESLNLTTNHAEEPTVDTKRPNWFSKLFSQTARIQAKTEALKALNAERDRASHSPTATVGQKTTTTRIRNARAIMWPVAIMTALALACTVVATQINFWKGFFGAAARPLDFLPQFNLAYITPVAFEAIAWVFTLMAFLAVITNKPSALYQRYMWVFSSFAAVVNAGHNIDPNDLGRTGSGLVLGGFSLIGPLIIDKMVRFDRHLQTGRTAADFMEDQRAAYIAVLRSVGGIVLHPVLTGRAVWRYTQGLYPTYALAYQSALLDGDAHKQITGVIRDRFLRSALTGLRGRPVVVHVTNPLDAAPIDSGQADAEPGSAAPVEPADPERPETVPTIDHGSVLTLDSESDIDPEVERLMAALDDPRLWVRTAQDGAHTAAQEPAQPEVESDAQDGAQEVRTDSAQGLRTPSSEVRTDLTDDGAQADAQQGAQGCAGEVTSEDQGAQPSAQGVRKDAAQPGVAQPSENGAQGAHGAADGEVRSPAQGGVRRAAQPRSSTSKPAARAGAQRVAQASTGETSTGEISPRDVAIHGMDQLYGEGTDPRTLSKVQLGKELGVSKDTARRALPEWCKRNGLPEDAPGNE